MVYCHGFSNRYTFQWSKQLCYSTHLICIQYDNPCVIKRVPDILYLCYGSKVPVLNRWRRSYQSFVSSMNMGVRTYQSGTPLHWHHNDQDGVSNYQPHGCLLNHLFGCKSKKTSKLRVIGLCVGLGLVNSLHKGPVTQKMFPFDRLWYFYRMVIGRSDIPMRE